MTRLTLLQFRTQALVAIAALAALAALVATTGLHVRHVYDTTVVGCGARGDCGPSTNTFLATYPLLKSALDWLALFIPVVVGLFWGAPLIARELETGTFRLAWTQSVSRKRWIVVKLGATVLAGLAATGLLVLLVTWWSSPFDTVTMNRFSLGEFDIRGVAAIGYGAFAIAVGATAGLLTRRMLPAMAITPLVFIAVRVGVALWVLPHVMAPVHLDVPLNDTTDVGISSSPAGEILVVHAAATLPNAWVVSEQIVDAPGKAITTEANRQFVKDYCPGVPNDIKSQAFIDCFARFATKYHLTVAYQPANRYWTFQWIDAGIFSGLSLGLAGFSFWWLRRRVA